LARQRVEEVVERLGSCLAEELGYELVDVEYRKEGPDWVLRCSIDSQTGVGVDDCQRFSEALGKTLDIEDPIPGHYLLEVSSPGIERPLKKDHDFIRFAGKKIEVSLLKLMNGRKVYQGELLGLNEPEAGKMLRMKIDDLVLEIPRSEIAKVHLIPDIFGTEGGKKRK
jgi:ribosome maturation factor RimP